MTVLIEALPHKERIPTTISRWAKSCVVKSEGNKGHEKINPVSFPYNNAPDSFDERVRSGFDTSHLPSNNDTFTHPHTTCHLNTSSYINARANSNANAIVRHTCKAVSCFF